MIKKLLLIFVFAFSSLAFSQKKILDHTDYSLWNVIKNKAISNDGKYVLYSLEQGEKDHYFKIQDGEGNYLLAYDRGQKGKFTYDSKFALFTIKAWKDSVLNLKRKKVKKDKLPKDSLGIFNIVSNKLQKNW